MFFLSGHSAHVPFLSSLVSICHFSAGVVHRSALVVRLAKLQLFTLLNAP